MKKRFLVLLILSLALLSACKGINISALPTVPAVQVGADTDLATRVAKILTAAATQAVKGPAQNSPTSTPDAKGPIPGDPPTQVPTATFAPSPTPVVVNTAIPTLVPTATTVPTLTPPPAQTATLIPTAKVNVLPIAASTEDPRNRLGPPTSGDPMDNPTTWTWPTGSDQYTSAEWANGSMRVTALTSTAGWRLPVAGPFGDAYIEMTARSVTCSGKDNYGIFFRVPDKMATSGYWFVISCDGFYRLSKWDGSTEPKGTYDALINWTASKKIRQGAGQPNRLGVLLKGDKISLFVNGNYLNAYRDATYLGGFFGAFINAKTTANYSVDIDEMDYWNNPQ
jgi:hypothetical protein